MKAILSCLILISAGATAQARPGYLCQTTSRTKVFEYVADIESFASSFVTDLCKHDGATINSECEANVFCYDQYNPPELLRCETLSNGKSFSADNHGRALAERLAVDRCKNDGSTINSACEANVVCDYADALRRPVRCQTHSNTRIFEGVHTQESFARTQAVDLCKKDGGTINSQCEANVVCARGHHGGHGPVMECKTHSAGRIFSAENKNEGFAASLATDRCKKDGATINSQCEANLVCAPKRGF